MTRLSLLHLDPERLSVWHWRDGQLERGPAFAPDEAGLAEFEAWLEPQRGTHLTALADSVDESFLLETLPHVQGRDRRALQERRVAQLAYGSPFAAAQVIGRESSGRRDDRVLFMALTRPSLVEPWLERLRRAPVVFRGLLSPALLAQHLLDSQALNQRPRVLVVCVSPSGIRQTLFEDGRMRFSRLATPASQVGDGWLSSLPYEVQKTYQYFVTQRLLQRGSQLLVHVLAAQRDFAALRQSCQDNEQLHFIFNDIEQRARALGLRNAAPYSDALPLLLHLAAVRPGRLQLAPASERQTYRWWQAQRLSLALATALTLGLLALAAAGLLEAQRLRSDALQIRLDARSDHLRYERLLDKLPQLPAPLPTIQRSIAALDHLETLAPGPAPALGLVSRALDEFPDVQLLRLEWRLGDEALQPRSTEALSQVVLQAQLVPPLGQKATLARIQALREALLKAGARETSIHSLPFDYASASTLRSSDPGQGAQGQSFALSVQVSSAGAP